MANLDEGIISNCILVLAIKSIIHLSIVISDDHRVPGMILLFGDKIPSGLNSKSLRTKGRYASMVGIPTLTGLTSLNMVLFGGGDCAQCKKALLGSDNLVAPGLRHMWENSLMDGCDNLMAPGLIAS